MFTGGDDPPFADSDSPPPSDNSGGLFSTAGQNGEDFESAASGPILPPPEAEGFALREWRRENAMRLEEKEKEEKEKVKKILEEAEEYKKEFYKKRQLATESNKSVNKEKEKSLVCNFLISEFRVFQMFLESREKFHAEAEKNYWKSIAELIPREVVAIEKRGSKKKDQNQPSIVVIKGPKPGKPTDLSRMRQILLKLKHQTPDHMIPKSEANTAPAEDTTAASSAAGTVAPAAVSAA
ncbi:Clathrin light chain 3 [Linum perenne]